MGEILVLVYLCLLFTALLFSILIYATNRKETLYRYNLGYWAGVMAAFFVQGAAQKDLTLSLYAFSLSGFLFMYPYCQIIAHLSDVPIKVKTYVYMHLASNLLSFGLLAANQPFWVYALAPSMTLGFSIIIPVVMANLKIKQKLFFRIASINFILLGLHDIDYAFLRPVPEALPFTFSVAIILTLGFGMFLPVLMLEKVKDNHSKNLEAKVIERTSELKKTQKQLVEKARMASLGGLVAGITHEINNPMNFCSLEIANLKSTAKYFQDKFKENEIQQKDVEEFFTELSGSLNRLNSHFVHVSKLIGSFKNIAVDVTKQTEKEINLVSYLEDLCKNMNLTQNNLVNIKFNCQGTKHYPFQIYPGLLFQVLSNLVLNSSKHGFEQNEQGTIEVDLKLEDPDFISIVYKDSGSGIDPSIKEQIFEPFFTTKPGAGGGTGIGLSVVYNIIVGKLGGHISVKSIGEIEKGVEFTMSFPKTGKAEKQVAA